MYLGLTCIYMYSGMASAEWTALAIERINVAIEPGSV